jgi:hypothetical protein
LPSKLVLPRRLHFLLLMEIQPTLQVWCGRKLLYRGSTVGAKCSYYGYFCQYLTGEISNYSLRFFQLFVKGG